MEMGRIQTRNRDADCVDAGVTEGSHVENLEFAKGMFE